MFFDGRFYLFEVLIWFILILNMLDILYILHSSPNFIQLICRIVSCAEPEWGRGPNPPPPLKITKI